MYIRLYFKSYIESKKERCKAKTPGRCKIRRVTDSGKKRGDQPKNCKTTLVNTISPRTRRKGLSPLTISRWDQ